ncbi:MAG: tyrosine-type recombinase/integrase [Candidatus Thiodiazotropha taylori]|nr:tyrosine-type recombinase/integrase [Candidatus Thiodiazotropha taylori]MCW4250971.1 tyrosine-type recombinase/integrase [Candidatus Thiodiazotropha endolucinida]MCG8045739.1 tyrosine-type recombinase/integrase [Candidatus Thiodiazotropha taylori]MCG8078287.1 tyrosine-type recombinase/integrase [Candidatus Thiodiazotropha taylori]MCG8112745.1 tyrosine-type recombinase/integrase [Candidatus Thiodiazotropha taylori]
MTEILEYLTSLHNKNLSYSSVNTAKSMLSSLLSLLHRKDIGKDPLIRHFMKGIFNLKPALPRYVNTWDVQVVIEYLNSLKSSELNLKLLSVKLATLLALATGQRCQTLWAINVKDIELCDSYMKIRIFQLLKQSKPNNHLEEMYFEPFRKNSNICVMKCMKLYIEKTQNKRKEGHSERLFIITQKPFTEATKSTIARWIKLALKLSGIDTSVFSTHSTRSAATSAAVTKIPIDTIIRTAGWTKDSTFRRFYKRPVVSTSVFSHSILDTL